MAASRESSLGSSKTAHSADSFTDGEDVEDLSSAFAEMSAQVDPDAGGHTSGRPPRTRNSARDVIGPGSGTHGGGTRSSHGRKIWNPYLERTDVGSVGIYNGNWGGRKGLLDQRRHIQEDVIYNSPAQVLILQEVDPEFKQQLAAATRTSHSPAVAGQAPEQVPMWYFVHGDESMTDPNSKDVLIAVKSSVAESITRVRLSKSFDGTYKAKKKKDRERGKMGRAYTHILVAEITWNRPLMGHCTSVAMSVHVHHLTARKEQKFGQAHADFLARLVQFCKLYSPTVVGGDFNMATWLVVPALRKGGVAAEVMAWYAWEGIEEGADLAEDPNENAEMENDDAVTTTARSRHQVPAVAGKKMCDSCLLMTCMPTDGNKRLLPDDLWDGNATDHQLDRFVKGQGYVIRSYLGDTKAVRESLAPLPDHLRALWANKNVGAQKGMGKDTPRTRGGGENPVTRCTQKTIKTEMFDAGRGLFNRGGHMPLLAYLGHLSWRKPDKIQRREDRSVRQDWGPSSQNRAWLMQQQGLDPPPKAKESSSAVAETSAEQSGWWQQWHTQGTSSSSSWQQPSSSWQHAGWWQQWQGQWWQQQPQEGASSTHCKGTGKAEGKR